VDENAARILASDSAAEQLRRNVGELQRDLAAARDRISALVVSEAQAREEARRHHAAFEDQAAAARAAVQAHAAVADELETTRRKLAQSVATEDECRAALEGARVQLHLSGRENDDKGLEVDRLRTKLTLALKQASDNHVTHLKLVEEKHRGVIEGMRAEARTQEATILKLRAQLSKADFIQGAARATDTATQIVDSGVRVAQEAEIKRLHAELAAAQAARDEAQLRMEEVQTARRAEVDDRTRDARRETDAARARCRELEGRAAALEAQLLRQREIVTGAQEDARVAAAERTRAGNERADLQRQLDEARRQALVTDERTKAASAEQAAQMEVTQRTLRALERRLEDARRDDAAARDRLIVDLDDMRRSGEEARAQLREANTRAAALQASLADRERAAEALGAKCERLEQGVHAHKLQLVDCDRRLSAATAREAQLGQELRTVGLHLEQVKMEYARLERARDRAAAEAEALQRHLASVTETAAAKKRYGVASR
jgi:chromosome segregation ATPase